MLFALLVLSILFVFGALSAEAAVSLAFVVMIVIVVTKIVTA